MDSAPLLRGMLADRLPEPAGRNRPETRLGRCMLMSPRRSTPRPRQVARTKQAGAWAVADHGYGTEGKGNTNG
jgi:hypothetical protein